MADVTTRPETVYANKRWTLLAWAPYSRRSEMFAKMLGGRLHCIHYLRFQSPLHAPLKYVLQAIRTLQVLFAERPQVVHVQNPPFVCGLVVYAYSLISGTRFVLDHHSATLRVYGTGPRQFKNILRGGQKLVDHAQQLMAFMASFPQIEWMTAREYIDGCLQEDVPRS